MQRCLPLAYGRKGGKPVIAWPLLKCRLDQTGLPCASACRIAIRHRLDPPTLADRAWNLANTPAPPACSKTAGEVRPAAREQPP
jgi:hypothetical protein